MHIPSPEIQTIGTVVVVVGDGDFVASPATVFHCPYVDVEVTIRLSGNVGYVAAIGRKNRISVDEIIIGEGPRLAGFDLQNLKLNCVAAVIGCIDNPFAVR